MNPSILQFDIKKISDRNAFSAANELQEEIRQFVNFLSNKDKQIISFFNDYKTILSNHQIPLIKQLSSKQSDLPFNPNDFILSNQTVISLLNDLKTFQKELASNNDQKSTSLDMKENNLRKQNDLLDSKISQFQQQLNILESQKILLNEKNQKIDEEYQTNTSIIYFQQQLSLQRQRQRNLEQMLTFSEIKSSDLMNKQQIIQKEIDTLNNLHSTIKKQLVDNEIEISKIQNEQKRAEVELQTKKRETLTVKPLGITKSSFLIPLIICDSENRDSTIEKEIISKLKESSYIQESQIIDFTYLVSSFLSKSTSADYQQGIKSLQNKLEKQLKDVRDSHKLNCFILVTSPQYPDSAAFKAMEILAKFIESYKNKIILTIYDNNPQPNALFKLLKTQNPTSNISYCNSSFNKQICSQLSEILLNEFTREDKQFQKKSQVQTESLIQSEKERNIQLINTISLKQDEFTKLKAKCEGIQLEKQRLAEIQEAELQIFKFQQEIDQQVLKNRQEQLKKFQSEENALQQQINTLNNSISELQFQKKIIQEMIDHLNSFKNDILVKFQMQSNLQADLGKEMDKLFSFIWAYSGNREALMLYYGVYKEQEGLKLDDMDYMNFERLLKISFDQSKTLLKQINISINKNLQTFTIKEVEKNIENYQLIQRLEQITSSNNFIQIVSKIKNYTTNKDILDAIKDHMKVLNIPY